MRTEHTLNEKQLINTIIFLVVSRSNNGIDTAISSFEEEADAKEFAEYMGNGFLVLQLPYNHN